MLGQPSLSISTISARGFGRQRNEVGALGDLLEDDLASLRGTVQEEPNRGRHTEDHGAAEMPSNQASAFGICP